MIANRRITVVIAVVMAISVLLCLCAIAFSDKITQSVGSNGVSMEYETELFNTDNIIDINILMDDTDWNDMLENATAEEYCQCDVEINGTTLYQVAIRPKGNTSLTSIANDPTTSRYSFKLEFDYYVDGQTCFGLDKLVLNNNYADATNMKEALIYDMYQYLGADASLYNYAKISVNGEYWGVYLALEAVEDSFMLRNYGAQSGELYKPESMNIGGGNDFDDADMDFSNMTPPSSQGVASQTDTSDFSSQSDTPPNAAANRDDSAAEPSADFGERPSMNSDFGGRTGGSSMAGNGADLNYIDDNLDSYSTIWDGEITSTNDADHKRVVTALKNISEGNDLESYMDVDNLLRYAAVHIFSVNDDSLSGSMAHNYYLYESDGRLNLIPWDYNLSFGGMGGDNATDVVNSAIDDAFSSTDFFDTMMANETYYEQYHAYLQQLVSEYINGGGFDAFYERVRNQIDELVKDDPTAFYSYDEYLTAVDTLYQIVKLRGESVSGQLDGSIPSTEDEQRDSNNLIDASSLSLSAMGSMNNGDAKSKDISFDFSNDEAAFDKASENSADNFSSPPEFKSDTNNNSNKQNDESQADDGSQQPAESRSNAESDKPSLTQQNENFPARDNQQPQDFSNRYSSSNSSIKSSLITISISVAVIVAAIFFALLYPKRKR